MQKKNNDKLDVALYFSNEDLRKEHRVFSRNINGTNYYFKTGVFLYNELLASEIFKLLNIPCLEYDLVKINNKFYIVSKDYKNENCIYKNGFDLYDEYVHKYGFNENEKTPLCPCKKKSCDEFFWPYNSLETIWGLLIENKVKEEDIREIMVTFIKYFSMSIILLDYDFHPGNWEIEFSKNKASVVPKYDNEQILCSSLTTPSFYVDSTAIDCTFTSSIEYFLSISSESDRYIFMDLLNKCDENLFDEAEKILFNRYGVMIDELILNQHFNYSRERNKRRFSTQRDTLLELVKNMEIMGR